MQIGKICTVCGETKPYPEFPKDKSRKSGYGARCKSCESQRLKAFRVNNYEKVMNKDRARRERNPEYFKEVKKRWRENNPNGYKEQIQRDRANDPLYDFKMKCRRMLKESFQRRGFRKQSKFKDIVGLSPAELSGYLIKTFIDRYGYEPNLKTRYAYHIDHIIPICTASTEEDVLKLSHYTNLQLLTAEDNLKKGSSVG